MKKCYLENHNFKILKVRNYFNKTNLKTMSRYYCFTETLKEKLYVKIYQKINVLFRRI